MKAIKPSDILLPGWDDHYKNKFEKMDLDITDSNVKELDVFRNALKALRRGRNIIKEANKTYEQVQADDSMTDDQKAISTMDYMDKKGTELTEVIKKPHQELSNYVAEIDNTIQTETKRAAIEDNFAGETRKHVKSLKKNNRLPFLSECIETQDWQSVMSIIGSKPFLSGLEKKDVDVYKKIYQQKRFGQKMKLRDMADELADKIFNGAWNMKTKTFDGFKTTKAKKAKETRAKTHHMLNNE